MKRHIKISLSVLISIMFLICLYNNTGNNFLNFDIKSGKGIIKANFLKFFVRENYDVEDDLIFIKNRNKEVLRQWKIVKKDSMIFYYKVVDEKLEAMGIHEFYRYNSRMGYLEYITIGMSTYPDNTSDLNIFRLNYSNDLVLYSGKIKSDVKMGYNQRGLDILENMISRRFDGKLLIKDTLKYKESSNNEIERIFRL